jgi:hypothetical protein
VSSSTTGYSNYGGPGYNTPPLQGLPNLLNPEWYKLFVTLVSSTQQTSQGGSTRPTSPTLYQSFFDTNLQQPIWCAATSPSIIWKNAAGVAV